MKRIGICFFCVVAFGCVTSGILYRKSEEAKEIRLEKAASEFSEKESSQIKEKEISEIKKEVLEVSDVSVPEKRFFVTEEDGYLVIYDRTAKKQYDDTTIQIQDLPEYLKEKLTEGLYFTDEEELYRFLENYSS